MTVAGNFANAAPGARHEILYSAHADIPFRSEDDDIDFEAEYAVIVDHTALGTTPERAIEHIKLIAILNDWSLRAFGPSEMKGGFGFLQALA